MNYRRLVALAAGHPRIVLAVWAAALVTSALVTTLVPGNIANRGYTATGYESAHAVELLRAHVPGRTGTVILAELTGRYEPASSHLTKAKAMSLTQRQRQGDVEQAVKQLKRVPAVASVEPLVGEDLLNERTGVLVQDGLIAVRLDPPEEQAERHISDVEAALGKVAPDRLSYGLVGPLIVSHRYTQLAHQDLRRAELIAFPLVFVVLLVAFLSLVAAALPVVLGGITLVTSLALLHLISTQTGLSVFVVNAAAAVAMGLSIDYALFVVTRYREELQRDQPAADAVVGAMESAGRAVLLSGTTVALALLALLLVDVGVFSSMALGGILATLVAMLAAITLLPACLRLLGTNVDRLAIRPAATAARRGTLWRRLGTLVTRHPSMCALASVLVLLALAAPATGLRLDFRNLGELPGNDPVTRHLHRIATIFGAGATGPITVATKRPEAAKRVIGETKGVRGIWRTTKGREGWSAIDAVLTTGPDANATHATIDRLRQGLSRAGPSYMAGLTPEEMDLSNEIASSTPVVIVVAVLVALFTLGVGLRSIVIPIKGVVCSLLSVAATLGVLRLLFPSAGAGDSLAFFVPLFIFVLVFGLSIDYEVFLLSRVREAVSEGRSTTDSVRFGLMRSGRPITLAGLTVAIVFAAFSMSTLTAARQLGIGVAIAVLLDVTLVRCLLIPSAIVLLGRWNWWLPRRSPRKELAGG